MVPIKLCLLRLAIFRVRFQRKGKYLRKVRLIDDFETLRTGTEMENLV